MRISRLQNKLVETKTDLRNSTASQKLSPPEPHHLTAVRAPQGRVSIIRSKINVAYHISLLALYM
jgi:hypothetical protein